MGKLNLIRQLFGGMYEETPDGSPITITAAGTYYQWTTIDGSDVSGTGLIEYDATNKQLVIKKAIKADLHYKTVFSSKEGTVVQLAVFKTPFGGSPTIIPSHKGWASLAGAESIYPSSMVATAGVLTGSVSQLQQADLNYVTGSELAATPGFRYDFTFLTNKVPRHFYFQGKYIHFTSHNKKWLAYDYGTSAWVYMVATATVPDDMKDIGNDFDRTQDYIFPAGTFVQNGEVKIRCEHTSGGNAVATVVYFDKMFITPRDVRSVATVTYPVDLAVDDRLDLRFTSSESGVVVNSHITNLSLVETIGG